MRLTDAKTHVRLRHMLPFVRKGRTCREETYFRDNKGILTASAGAVDLCALANATVPRRTVDAFSQLALKSFVVLCFRELIHRRKYVPPRMAGFLWRMMKAGVGGDMGSCSADAKYMSSFKDHDTFFVWRKFIKRHERMHRQVTSAVATVWSFLSATKRSESTVFAMYSNMLRRVTNIGSVWPRETTKTKTTHLVTMKTRRVSLDWIIASLIQSMGDPQTIAHGFAARADSKRDVFFVVDNVTPYDIRATIAHVCLLAGIDSVLDITVHESTNESSGLRFATYVGMRHSDIVWMSVLLNNLLVMRPPVEYVSERRAYAYMADYVMRFIDTKSSNQRRAGLTMILHWFDPSAVLRLSDVSVAVRSKAIVALQATSERGKLYRSTPDAIRMFVDATFRCKLNMRAVRSMSRRSRHIKWLETELNVSASLDTVWLDQRMVDAVAHTINSKPSAVALISGHEDDNDTVWNERKCATKSNGKRTLSNDDARMVKRRKRHLIPKTKMLLYIEAAQKAHVVCFDPDEYPTKTVCPIVSIDVDQRACTPVDAFPVLVSWLHPSTGFIHPQFMQRVHDLPDIRTTVTPSLLCGTHDGEYDPTAPTINISPTEKQHIMDTFWKSSASPSTSPCSPSPC